MQERSILKWFRRIAMIPRCSGDEERISTWLLDQARSMGLEAERDAAWNVVVRKGKGTPVILQGHLDMVGEKESGHPHDFRNDPICLIEEGEWLRADGTTLGADNGIALAMALSLLEEDDPEQPALELLMTSGEEIGLLGAKAFAAGRLKGRMLINLDAESEGVFLTSCAGGETVELDFPIERESEVLPACRLRLGALRGGHSGLDIDKGRLNAIQSLNRFLLELDAALISFAADGKFNAICRQAEALLLVRDREAFKERVEAQVKIWRESEPQVELITEEGFSGRALSEASSRNLLRLLEAWPNGVYSMSPDLPTVVESSSNMGLLRDLGDRFLLTASLRSSSEEKMGELKRRMRELAEAAGAELRWSGAYPGWSYEKESRLRDTALRVWEDCFAAAPRLTAIHGGLECGILKAKYPEIEMLSLGADLRDVHTPRERLSISSAERVLGFLRRLLHELKRQTSPGD